VTAYNADLSYASLSADGIDALLSDHKETIQKKYIESKEIQDRLNPKSMQDIMKMIQEIEKSVDDYHQFWKFKIYNQATSVIVRLQSSFSKCGEMAISDLESLFANASNYKSVYEDNLHIEREWIAKVLDDSFNAYNYAVLPLLSDWKTRVTDKGIANYINRLESCLDLIDLFQREVESYGDISKFRVLADEEKHHYVPNAAVIGKRLYNNCTVDHIKKTIKKNIRPILEGMLSDLKTEKDLSLTYGEILSNQPTQLFLEQQIIALNKVWNTFGDNIKKCVNEYKKFITQTGLKAVSEEITYRPRLRIYFFITHLFLYFF
jgi:hypothetical protein